MTTVISLGGSIVAPEGPDSSFLGGFRALVERHLAADTQRRLILVVGGGSPARLWQRAYREILAETGSADAVEVCRRAGFDIETPAFWKRGLSVFEKQTAEFEVLARG